MKKTKTTFFISDLHLAENTPELTQIFLAFLHRLKADEVDALYILGDLFESWIGDEDMLLHADIIQALAAVTKSGVMVFFLHGNRDFLVGKKFFTETGCQLLAEESNIQLYGTSVLLLHGDTLCTRDIAYIKARKYLRNPFIQSLFLLLPVTIRKKIAHRLRKMSRKHTAFAASEIMDVTAEEVQKTMLKHRVRFLIHGHTHRPATHQVLLGDEQPGLRIVLGAWEKQGGKILAWDEFGNKELRPPNLSH